MRTAPCPTAPAIQVGGRFKAEDLRIPAKANFTYFDMNSRQTSACSQYGYSPEDSTTCWVQGTYQNITGWVPIATGTYVDPVCTLAFDAQADFLVSDGTEYYQNIFGLTYFVDNIKGCALPTVQPELKVPYCFPGSAVVSLSDGTSLRISELNLGDKVSYCFIWLTVAGANKSTCQGRFCTRLAATKKGPSLPILGCCAEWQSMWHACFCFVFV